MNVFLLDGTYELFRHFFAVPARKDSSGREMGAVRGVLGSALGMLEDGVTHLGVATDHVVESFRNDLYEGYKSGERVDADLLQQFQPLEEALRALGVVVWPMVEFEADDALASAARVAEIDDRVEQVFICTPDKDLTQCVHGRRVVQFDRRAGVVRDADGVQKRFGVWPASIVDYLALVGDASGWLSGVTRVGPPSLPRRYWHGTRVSRRSHRTRRNGTSRFVDRPGWPALWQKDAATLNCSETSRRCVRLCPSVSLSTISTGPVLLPRSSICAPA